MRNGKATVVQVIAFFKLDEPEDNDDDLPYIVDKPDPTPDEPESPETVTKQQALAALATVRRFVEGK